MYESWVIFDEKIIGFIVVTNGKEKQLKKSKNI